MAHDITLMTTYTASIQVTLARFSLQDLITINNHLQTVNETNCSRTLWPGISREHST